ncbi:MAG: 2-amino-4-hydroxy-6-hydroxymethyldihydropteridine diphosphokinase [Bergeyella zoohelcum]|nr:2-amino-4-hydroxy-6-hydroxymethyldihydropteridine diphosphokinase [Bergeyella zoohelcum]
MQLQTAVLLLGTNIGNKVQNIETAIQYIEKEIGEIKKKTEILETKPVEFVSQNIFYNFATIIETHLSPIALLKKIKEIEQKMGRMQDSRALDGYADRVMDIDIVSYSNVCYKSDRLGIPHRKHLFEREFSKELLRML